MAIHGISIWLKTSHQLDWPWINASEHEAAGNLEQAAYQYKLLLNEHFQKLSTQNEEKISSALVKFLTQKVRMKNKKKRTIQFVGFCVFDFRFTIVI